MTRAQVNTYKDKYHIGDKITVTNPAEAGKELFEVKIYSKFSDFVMVTNGKYKWCVDWIEVMKANK